MSKMDFKEYIQQQQPRKVVLLHHWDTDGLASAALIKKYLKNYSAQIEVVLRTPTINNYFFKQKDYDFVQQQGPDAIVIVDLNIPLENIEQFEKICKHVFVFDHHSQTAKIDRPGVQDTSYPGCSMLVSDYLGLPASLVGVLGMIGDQPETIADNERFWPAVELVMQQLSLQFHDLKKIATLADTMYILYDIEGFSYTINLLQKDPVKILEDDRFLKNEQQIMQEMSKNLEAEMQEIGQDVLYMSIKSEMSILSEVTRYKAKKNPDKIVVVDHVRGEEASLYVRRTNKDIDLGVVVELAREKGYNAGGKPEVAGIVLPVADLTDFRQQIIEYLKNS